MEDDENKRKTTKHPRMPAVGTMALSLAVVALVASALPYPGMFVAMAIGILGAGAGMVAWRRRSSPGALRLAGVAGVGIAGFALLIAGGRYLLTLAAVTRLIALVP